MSREWTISYLKKRARIVKTLRDMKISEVAAEVDYSSSTIKKFLYQSSYRGSETLQVTMFRWCHEHCPLWKLERENRMLERDNRTLIRLPFLDSSVHCIVKDAPWDYREKGMRGNEGGTRPDQNLNPGYDRMPLRDIIAMGPEINRIAKSQCHLWMWTVEPFYCDTEAMMALWGFPRKRTFIWVKTTDGLRPGQKACRDFSRSRLQEAQEVMEAWGQPGQPYPRAGGRYYGKTCVEFLLMGTNDTSFYLQNGKLESQVFFASVPAGHSSKPDIAFEIIRRNSPGPRVSLFERTERDGFACWGNQMEGMFF